MNHERGEWLASYYKNHLNSLNFLCQLMYRQLIYPKPKVPLRIKYYYQYQTIITGQTGVHVHQHCVMTVTTYKLHHAVAMNLVSSTSFAVAVDCHFIPDSLQLPANPITLQNKKCEMIIYIKKIAFIFNALLLVLLGIALLAGRHLSFFPHS